MYSFSVEDTDFNRSNSAHFRNYLTSAVYLTHQDFVIFNEIKVSEEEQKTLFGRVFIKDKNKEKNTIVCFSIVPDSAEPDKVEGVFDIPVDENVTDIKLVTDTYRFIKKGENQAFLELISDIAIIIELESKKIIFQRNELWSDNLTIDIYDKNEMNMFYLSLTQTFGIDEMKIDSFRRIESLNF